MESDEADGSFPPWVSLEYTQMLSLANPAPVIFSSLSLPSVHSLRNLLTPPSVVSSGSTQGGERLLSGFRTENKSVRELMEMEGVKLERVCLLDPKAEKGIHPTDREEFDWFLQVPSLPSLFVSYPGRSRSGELIPYVERQIRRYSRR